jgi:Cysteine-rich secretory protein family
MRTASACPVSLMALLPLCAVRADLPTSVDITDVAGCAADGAAVVKVSDVLNGVARELSRGGELRPAIDAAGYGMATAELLYLKSPLSDDAIRDIIEDRYCTAERSRTFTEFGIHRSGNEAWILLATPIERPWIGDPVTVATRVLELVNTARKHPRRCGDREFGAAPPLTLSPALTNAASRHAHDMAQHGSFQHVGSDGSRPAEQVAEAGYRWRVTGENIAAGQSDPDTVDLPRHNLPESKQEW